MLRKHTKATSGRILFDEKPLESFSNTSYFDELSFVEQNVFLFEDTLRNNITLYGDYSEQWSLSAPGGVETLSLTNLAFTGYYTGGNHEYIIFSRLLQYIR